MANQPREGSVPVCYRLDGALLDRMQQAARELGITYTAFVTEAIENKLDQMTVKRSEGTSRPPGQGFPSTATAHTPARGEAKPYTHRAEYKSSDAPGDYDVATRQLE